MIILIMSLKEREFMLSASFKIGLGVLGWFIILILKIWIVLTLLLYIAKNIGLNGIEYWVFSIVGAVWILYLIGTFDLKKQGNSLDILMKQEEE